MRADRHGAGRCERGRVRIPNPAIVTSTSLDGPRRAPAARLLACLELTALVTFVATRAAGHARHVDFHPTDEIYCYLAGGRALLRLDLPCSPCQRKVCPLGHHRCMRDIAVDDVLAAAERLLAAPATR